MNSINNIAPIFPEFNPPEFIEKTCPSCGKTFTVSTAKKRGRKQIYCSYRCGTDFHCNHVRDKDAQSARVAKHFSDYPEKRFLASTKQLAKAKNIAFALDESWFKERLERGVCEVTGLPIRVKQYKKDDQGGRGFFSPSIDRIDNSVGYIPSNCRVVAWGYNLAKNEYTDREVNALAVAVLIQSIPRALKAQFLDSLPNILVAALPSGHTLF